MEKHKGLKYIFSAFFCSTVGRCLGYMRRKISPYSPIILAYHSVCPEPNAFFKGLHNVTPELFERQIIFLKKNYNVCSLDELVFCLKEKKPRKNLLAVTFDDGFRSAIDYAYPVLLRWRIPATIYLISELMENKKLFWRNKLTYILNSGLDKMLFDLLSRDHSRKLSEFSEDYKREHVEICAAIDKVFASVNLREEDIAQKYRFYIERGDILKVDKRLISFGSHTKTHPVLNGLSMEGQIDEICGSYKRISLLLDRKDLPFAYPFGKDEDFNEDSKRLAIEEGYTSITRCSNKPRQNRIDSSPFDLDRIAPSKMPVYMLTSFLEGTTIAGIYSLIKQIFARRTKLLK